MVGRALTDINKALRVVGGEEHSSEWMKIWIIGSPSAKPLLLFLTFRVLVANPKNLLYAGANPARGLLDGEKRTKKICQHPHPPLLPAHPTLLVRRKIK